MSMLAALPYPRPFHETPLAFFTAPRDVAKIAVAPIECKIPRYDHIDESFYPSRRLALAGRGYTPASSMPIAVDVASGTGAKQYNTLPRQGIAPFIRCVPPTRRNLYCVVDPALPCDAFFDVDATAKSAVESETQFNVWRLSVIDAALPVLIAELAKYFEVPVESVAVFDASRFMGQKASFHVHIRMSGGRAFRNVKEHHHFAMHVLKPALQQWDAKAVQQGNKVHRAEAGVAEEQGVAAAPSTQDGPTIELSHFVDLSVYTAWRLFRLPLCSKRYLGGTNGTPLTFLAPESLSENTPLRSLLAQYRPSTAAVPDDATVDEDDIMMGSAAAFDLALITRAEPTSDLVLKPQEGNVSPSLQGLSSGTLAPLRVGVRSAVTDRDNVEALLRLFQSIDPHFDPANPVSHGGIVNLTRAEYEDNGQIRMYYVLQKQSRWCLKQQREHKSTHGQLFVTYGSIKYRCYSNDCFESCVVVPWDEVTIPIRDQLFPALPEAELFRRYPELAPPIHEYLEEGERRDLLESEDDMLAPADAT